MGWTTKPAFAISLIAVLATLAACAPATPGNAPSTTSGEGTAPSQARKIGRAHV